MRSFTKHVCVALAAGVTTSVFTVLPVQAKQESEPYLSLYEGGPIAGNLIDYRIAGPNRITAFVLLDARIGVQKGYASAALAKADARKIKGPEVILRYGTDKAASYVLYSMKMAKTSPANLELAQANKFADIANDPSIAQDYDSMKCKASFELFLPDRPLQDQFTVEAIINDSGLSITGYEFGKTFDTDLQIIERTIFRELLNDNNEEVKAAYACFNARSTAITDKKEKAKFRYSFLSSMWVNYRRGAQYHSFVEAEMKRLKYTAAQKAQIRGETPFTPGVTEVIY